MKKKLSRWEVFKGRSVVYVAHSTSTEAQRARTCAIQLMPRWPLLECLSPPRLLCYRDYYYSMAWIMPCRMFPSTRLSG